MQQRLLEPMLGTPVRLETAGCRDYHLLLDEQAEQLYVMTALITARIRMMGGAILGTASPLRNWHYALRNGYAEPLDLLEALYEANQMLRDSLMQERSVFDERRDIETASFFEVWIDETKRRSWFLFQAG